MGAQFPWQVVPLSIDLIKTYDLLDTDNFPGPRRAEADHRGQHDPPAPGPRAAAGPAVNAGLLSEVNTYTWRSPEVMLSTAQDWRKGQRSEQVHDEPGDTRSRRARLHQPSGARTPPLTEQDARSDSSYYWTGQASAPRSVQHDKVNVSIYAPQYENSPGNPIPYLQYENLTHAFFPTEHFDQVVQQDGWTIGRKGDGYVALWSWRPTQWRTYSPGDYTLGLTQSFDLVADGGADNVWITEVGRAGRLGRRRRIRSRHSSTPSRRRHRR